MNYRSLPPVLHARKGVGAAVTWPGILFAAALFAFTAQATLLWDGNATNGLSVFKLINIEGTNGSSVTAVSDPIYGTVWQFYKALNDHRCEAHGAAGINPAVGQTYYIGWRTRFVMPTAASLNAIFQWKAYGEPMLQNYPITIAPGGGVLSLNQFNPSDAGGQTTLWSTPVVTNAWVSHVLAINVSTQDYGGYIEYWYNGAQQTFSTGTNRFYCRTFDGTSVDPKWGVYGGDIYTVIDYVSGLRIGTAYADVVDTLYATSASPASQITGLTGTNITYTVNVVTNSGFSGSITLSVSGLPANTSFRLSPTSFTGPGAATLSVTTSNTTPQGTYTLLFRAIDGAQTNYTTVEMIVSKVPGTYVWNGPGAGANNWSSAGNWSPAGPPGTIDSVEFFNQGATGVSNINNVVEAGFSGAIAALQYGNTNNNHTTLIATGQTLNVGGGLTVGTETDNGSSQTVFATLTGPGGTLAINNAGVDWVIRQGAATSGGSQRATLEMSGLGMVNAVMGRLLVGVAGPVARATGTVYLGKTNTLYAFGATPQICVGDNHGNGGGANYLYLGQANTIFADSITVGGEKATGTMLFNSRLSNPMATFRASDGASPVNTWTIGDNSAQSTSSSSSSGTNDFSLGHVDALVNTMSVGVGQTSTGANGSGLLTFSSGTINVNTLNIGVQSASGATSAGIGRVNVNGTNALLVVNSSLTLGFTSGGGGTSNTYGVLNINGGTVLANTIAAGSGSGADAILINSGKLAVTNTVGTPGLGINSVSLTNATLQVSVANGQACMSVSNLVTGGATSVINIAALPAVGSVPAQFQLLQYAGSIGGAGYHFNLGSLPAGGLIYGGYLSNNAAAHSVDLVITNATAPVPPTIGTIRLSGSNLVISGSGGTHGAGYYVLCSTNVALPRTAWTPLLTNSFAPDGSFTFTTPVAPGASRQFYLLQVQ
ncbi:MAG TPA: heparin lyase I family protein [Candidatus Acidoferrum sp.]|nr:heparin lyase I family protein [Candidatus Acidoferrum sp.]